MQETLGTPRNQQHFFLCSGYHSYRMMDAEYSTSTSYPLTKCEHESRRDVYKLPTRVPHGVDCKMQTLDIVKNDMHSISGSHIVRFGGAGKWAGETSRIISTCPGILIDTF